MKWQSAQLRRAFGGGLLVAASLLVALIAQAVTTSAQTTGAQTPAPPDPPAPTARVAASSTTEAKALLQDLYRQVYELQLEISRVDSDEDRARLEEQRAVLLQRIEAVRDRVERIEDEGVGDVASADSTGLGAIVGELQRIGVDTDWESIGKIFEGNAQSFGRSLAEIGRQLENMQIDVDPEGSRVRIDTGQGGKFSFTVPEDVQQDIRKGIAQMGLELQRVLADSSRGSMPDEIRGILNQLPEGVRRSWSLEPKVKRHVVARNVFKSFKDFEVAEDEIIAGDLIVVGGDAYVAGEVRGNTWVLFGDVLVEGRGEVAKDAVSVGGEVVVDDDAKVGGSRFDAAGFLPSVGIGFLGSGSSSQWLVHSVRVGVLALLLLLGFAVAGDRVGRMVDHSMLVPARDLAAGTLWFPATLGAFVVAAVGLAISVIGIPVVLVLAAAFFVVVLLAYLVGCQFVGTRFYHLFADEDGRPDWAYALLGLALLEAPALLALTLAPRTEDAALLVALRVVDYVVKFLAIALGFGALVATRIGGREMAEPVSTPPGLPAPSDV